jgi:hypothetical protein
VSDDFSMARESYAALGIAHTGELSQKEDAYVLFTRKIPRVSSARALEPYIEHIFLTVTT